MYVSYIVEVKVHVNNLSWLKFSDVNWCSFGGSCHFSVQRVVRGSWFNFLEHCFVRSFRVWWRKIDFIALSEGWSIRKCISSHHTGRLLKELLVIGFMGIVMILWLELYYCSILSTSIVMNFNNCWSLSLTNVLTLSIIPVAVVVCNHLRSSVPTLMNLF